jgi:hypothetical protein
VKSGPLYAFFPPTTGKMAIDNYKRSPLQVKNLKHGGEIIERDYRSKPSAPPLAISTTSSEVFNFGNLWQFSAILAISSASFASVVSKIWLSS